MAKKFKKTQKPCQSHLFSLKPGSKHNSSARSLNLTLSFCSRNVDTPADVQDEIKCIEAPIYNDDRSFASPAFTLPSDKIYYLQRRNKMLDQHELRYAFYTDQKTELNVPKPKSKNCYCSVCRQYYQDYLGHVQSPTHKNKIALSPFSKHIQDLTRTFNNHHSLKKPLSQSKTTIDRSIIIEDISSDNSDEVQIISNPYKKIKYNETNTGKESNHATSVVVKNNQIEQTYYPFSAWHSLFKPQPWQTWNTSWPVNFSFNFTINPLGFEQNIHPFVRQVASTGFQPFCANSQNLNSYGFGPLSGA